MEAFLLYLVAVFLSWSGEGADPAQHAWQGRQEARQVECERMSQARAHEEHPAEVPAPHMRSSALVDVDALVCGRRLLRWGERDDRDELVLSTLGSEVGSLVQQATAVAGPQR